MQVFLGRLILVPFFTLLMICGSMSAFAGSWDAAELEGFIDGVMVTHMGRNQATAGVVSVVKDGKVVIKKGYGSKDYLTGGEIDPDVSRFRIGSVSKLLTYTAIMQLYEQGRVDLDANVNDYLSGFRFPESYGKATTIKHLMTHTSGLEASLLGGLIDRDKGEVDSLLSSLSQHVPMQVRAPGEFISYSNFGVTVLGRVIEEVSGQPFCDYIKQHIYQPLDMVHSDFCEPEDPDIREEVVTAYVLEDGQQTKKPFEYIGSWAPAGSMSSSATDMANFMLMHLGGGVFNDVVVLKPETTDLMHSTAFSSVPGVPGMAYGFMEKFYNGYRAIAHGGATTYFFSYLLLVPDEGVGIFYSFTGGKSGAAFREPAEAFMNHYFPSKFESVKDGSAGIDKDIADNHIDESIYTGVYRSMRMEYSKPTKLLFALDDVTVSDNGGDSLLINKGGEKKRYRFKESTIFVSPDTGEEVGFVKDDRGQVNYAHFSARPYHDYYRVAWYEEASFIYATCIVSVLFFIVAFIASVSKFNLSKFSVLFASASGLLFWFCLIYVFISLDEESLNFNGTIMPSMMFDWVGGVLFLSGFLSVYGLLRFLPRACFTLPFVYQFCILANTSFTIWFGLNWNFLGG